MSKKELLEEFERKFSELKTKIKFKPTLDDLDRIFFVKDGVLKDNFVSDNTLRQISKRIIDNYMGWNDYLYSLIMPNPQNILNVSESKIFTKEEKESIMKLIQKIMELISRSNLVILTNDDKIGSKFIDDSVHFWDTQLKNNLIKTMSKVNSEWGRS